MRTGLGLPCSMGSRGSNNQYTVYYPWLRWFCQPEFTLTKGVHFRVDAYVMVQNIRNAASPKRHNVKVSIRVLDQGRTILVQVKNHYDTKGK